MCACVCVCPSSTSTQYRSLSQSQDRVGQPACWFDRRPCRPNSSCTALFLPLLFSSPRRSTLEGCPCDRCPSRYGKHRHRQRWSRKTPASGAPSLICHRWPVGKVTSALSKCFSAQTNSGTHRRTKARVSSYDWTEVRCEAPPCVKNPLSS